MKESLRSAMYLLAPCVGLGAFALFLARRPRTAPTVLLQGPFQVSVQGIETPPLHPINVSEGYDRRFHLVLQASGTRPKWWGQSTGGRSGTEINGWKFWLERGGKRTAFKPTKTLIWTTDWDAEKKRYFNEFLLHCGQVPADASLKVSGTARMTPGNGITAIRTPLPFEVTLKEAGKAWTRPHLSTDSRIIIRRVEIRRLQNGRTVGLVTVFAPPGANFNNSSMYMAQFLTGAWRPLDKPSYSFGLGFSSGSDFVRKSPSNRVQTFTFQWSTAAVGLAPQRDLIVTGRYSIASSWPLEMAFAIKKDGKSLFGVVPPLTRPAGR